MAGARVNQHVTIIRPTPGLLPEFLARYLASPAVQRMIWEIQVGATRQALTKAMIERFEVPIPGIPEQRRIVEKVAQFMALIDRLEAQLDAFSEAGERLLEAVVADLTEGARAA
jgi:type I restriction enzyme S subunit